MMLELPVGEMQVPPPSILPWTTLCVSPSLGPKSTAIAMQLPPLTMAILIARVRNVFLSLSFLCSQIVLLQPSPSRHPLRSLLQEFWCSLSVNNNETLFYVVLLYLKVLELGMAPSQFKQVCLKVSWKKKNLCPMSGRPPDFVTGETE